MRMFKIASYIKKVLTDYRLYVILILALFFLKGLDLAFNMKEGILPDENYHMELIEIYHNDDDGLIIENSPSSYHLGSITNIPYFYHLLNSKLLYLNFFGLEDLIFLRLVSLVFSTLTCFLIFKLAQKLTDNKLVWLMSLVIAANIPIFTFIAASVNYDVLTNFLAASAIYLLVVFMQKKRVIHLILLLTSLSLGCLTKISFVPLALIIGLLLIFYLRKEIFKFKFWRKKFTEVRENKAYIILALLSLVLMFGTAQFYIKNILNYHALVPNCDQIISIEGCMENPVYKRDKDLTSSKHESLKGPLEYSTRWFYLMLERSINEIGHQSLLRPKFILFIYAGLIFFSYTGFIRQYGNFSYKYKTDWTKVNYLLVIALFYTLILLFYQNYPTYRQNGNESIALQGRYILPIMAPISILLAQGFLMFKKRWLNILLIISISIFLITADYPYFRHKAGDNFFRNENFLTAGFSL